jgi:anaerobic selenocysteine-containing dehydrogenase
MSAIERASVCTFDCPDTCSLSVTVEDGRITKVRGSEAAPFTAGVICNKVARDMTAFVHGPQRILHPLRLTGPKAPARSSASPGRPRWTKSTRGPVQ